MDTHFSPRIQLVYTQVSELYQQTKRPEAQYLWQHHVQLVAQNAADLAERYIGNKDIVVAGALLHDIADIWMERDDSEFVTVTYKTVDEVLTKAGYTSEEINTIKQEIIEPHSCYQDNLPTTLEGKILATADALAHLNSNFYTEIRSSFPRMKLMTDEEYKAWALKKLNRDFHDKISFEEVRQATEEKYNELTQAFMIY